MRTNPTYTGKYAAKNHHTTHKFRGYRLLYLLNIALLVFAAACSFSRIEGHAAGAPETETTLPPDSVPPVISGVQDLLTYAGSDPSYLRGITAEDDTDPSPELTVDSSLADISRPGDYSITYIATDSSGNHTCAAATLTVLPWEEGYADLETIETAVSDILYEILTVGMTPREQVEAIYSWTHSALAYGGHTDRSDWRQAGYTMLTERRGDCYGYFAVTKLMFEQLGIPNIDVQKIPNSESDSDHFWSLVSVDGGETYYHFDSTPRMGQTESFCLVTDAFLDAYSENHKNSHNRDTSLYPATPEE